MGLADASADKLKIVACTFARYYAVKRLAADRSELQSQLRLGLLLDCFCVWIAFGLEMHSHSVNLFCQAFCQAFAYFAL